MSRIDPNQGITPSILDRIIDPDSTGTAWRRGYGVEQMERVVRRDLEDLLNTRQAYPDLAPEYQELHNSVLNYGLPDLSSMEAFTPEQRVNIGKTLEIIITRHEPRLKDVRVVLTGGGEPKDRTIKFHVDARLCLDPAPEVAFDTILELMTGHYSVKPSNT